MADEDNLVSKVSVEGTEAAGAKLKAYADVGAAAFDHLNKTAEADAARISAAAKQIEQSVRQSASSFSAFASAKIGQQAAVDMDAIGKAAGNLGNSFRRAVPAVAQFITRIAGISAVAIAGGAALLKAAENVAKGSNQQEAAIDKATAAQQRANDSSLQGEVAQINLASSQRQLFKQFQKGEITYSDYSKALKKLNEDYKEQQRVTRETEAATERNREANERAQKQAADTKAFNAQIDLFGGPLLTSLRALGTEATSLFNTMKTTFGPVVGQAIDLITNALSSNSGAINAFFTDAAAKAQQFITQNGPAIQTALTNIGNGVKAVFDGLIKALPGILDFFNNQIVPAVKAFGAALDVAAKGINEVFGTNLTGGGVAAVAIIGSVTGAFKALFTSIRLIFSLGSFVAALPFGPVLLAIGAAIALLLIAFPELRQTALDVFNAMVALFKSTVQGAKDAGAGIVAAWNAVLKFFTDFGPNLKVIFDAVWAAVASTYQAAIDNLKTNWNAVLQFFTDLWESIKSLFQQGWNAITGAFTAVTDTLKGLFTRAFAWAKEKLQPILDMLQRIKDAYDAIFGSSSDPGTTTVKAASGGYIRGPGSTTSDSIPALLSDKEFVIKAKSVAKYGLGLLHAINSGRFRMPRFNAGGLVSRMQIPSTGPRLAFAGGGLVSRSNLRPVSLNIFGEQFDGLLAPDDVGEKLGKFAVRKQTRSGGRKSSWVGRGRS